MRIEGVDQLILDQVLKQTAKSQVHNTKPVKVTTEKNQEQRGEREFKDELNKSVNQLNKAAEAFDIELRFKIDQEENKLLIYVVDVNEGKIIRRIPPENFLEAANRLQLMVGLMLDTFI